MLQNEDDSARALCVLRKARNYHTLVKERLSFCRILKTITDDENAEKIPFYTVLS